VSYYRLTFETGVERQQAPVVIIRADADGGQAPRRAVDVLRAGGLIVFPTEEGYLIGCNALDPGAVRRLCQVTGAQEGELVRFAGSPEQAARLGDAPRPLHHPVPLALMRDADLPMAATACPAGASPAPTAQHVVFVLGDAADLVLDAGPIRGQPVALGR
jgi:tRNA A37 threonylcarbamoyladenosine synthetase subunit TsaC/SUA5/YrdC